MSASSLRFQVSGAAKRPHNGACPGDWGWGRGLGHGARALPCVTTFYDVPLSRHGEGGRAQQQRPPVARHQRE